MYCMVGVNISLQMGVLTVATNSHQFQVWSSLHIFKTAYISTSWYISLQTLCIALKSSTQQTIYQNILYNNLKTITITWLSLTVHFSADMVHCFEDLYYVVHSIPFIRTVCIIVALKHNHLFEFNGTFHCRYGILLWRFVLYYVVHSKPFIRTLCITKLIIIIT